MHAGRNYSLAEMAAWTRRETAVFFLIATIPTALYALAGWRWLGISWAPIAVIGTAVAFITGFKNNASYARLWEGRQVWGAIVNTSRALAILVLDFIPDPVIRKRIFQRHYAWLTALRYQLREPRAWENMRLSHNTEYQRNYTVAEWGSPLETELAPLLSSEEQAYVLARKNRATHLIHLQAKDFRNSCGTTEAEALRHLELHRLLAALLDAQGKCERLKNYPYPRQFATLNFFFVWMFIVLLPFGLLAELQKLGDGFVWVTIPLSVLIAWVFHTMDKIGEISANPFEGSPNDVPVTSMSRTIEIDMQEMLGGEEPPAPISPVNNILM